MRPKGERREGASHPSAPTIMLRSSAIATLVPLLTRFISMRSVDPERTALHGLFTTVPLVASCPDGCLIFGASEMKAKVTQIIGKSRCSDCLEDGFAPQFLSSQGSQIEIDERG